MGFAEQECSYYFPHKNMWRAFFGSVIAVLVVQVPTTLIMQVSVVLFSVVVVVLTRLRSPSSSTP